jgi:hypothetical protein
MKLQLLHREIFNVVSDERYLVVDGNSRDRGIRDAQRFAVLR